jgi:predicted acyltransferase
MSAPGAAGRIASMDQFRGYTVAAMFVVNFLGGLDAVHPVLKHNNTYFSYADSVLPGFLFAVGFAYRLTLLRRLAQLGPARAYRRVAARALALILLSLVVFGFGASLGPWRELGWADVRAFCAKLLKADLWEVLAIIGAAQLLTLPVVAAGPAVRAGAMAALVAAHVALSYSFNYDFVYGRPNWMDAYWGAAGVRAWDGGFFGVLTWSVPLLAGTLAYDAVATAPGPVRAAGRLAGWGAAVMGLGYLLSCLSTLYDVSDAGATPADKFAASPVLPPLGGLAARPPGSLLAEPPFVRPPAPEVRRLNYWLMDKRVVTASFTVFATGFCLAAYALFVLACDLAGWRLELFRVLGQNPLAAYILHMPVERVVRALVPADAPLAWGLLGLAVFFTITVGFVRALDRRGIYLRL